MVTAILEETALSLVIQKFLYAKKVEERSPKTLEFYRDNLGRFSDWAAKRDILNLIQVDRNLIREFLAFIPQATWKHAHQDKNQPITVHAYFRALRAFFKWCIAEELITQYPLLNIKPPKVEKKVIPSISPEKIKELTKLFDKSFEGIRNKAIFYIFLDTGLRLMELTNVKVSDLNLKSGLIKVMGKGSKERICRLGAESFESLKQYLKARSTGKNEYLWLNKDGIQFQRQGFQVMIRRLGQVVGIKNLSPHKFRHTFALQWLRSGTDVFTLRKSGGWADLSILNRYLDGIQAEDAIKAHEKASPMDNLFNKPAKPLEAAEKMITKNAFGNELLEAQIQALSVQIKGLSMEISRMIGLFMTSSKKS